MMKHATLSWSLFSPEDKGIWRMSSVRSSQPDVKELVVFDSSFGTINSNNVKWFLCSWPYKFTTECTLFVVRHK